MSIDRRVLVLAAGVAALGLSGCGASGELDEAMAAACGGAEVETTGSSSSEEGVVEEQECAPEDGPPLTGTVHDQDPGDAMGRLSDMNETGDGSTLWRAEKEVGGEWVVVRATSSDPKDAPEALDLLVEKGFRIIG